MKEQIIEILNKATRALSVQEINDYMAEQSVAGIIELENNLKSLVQDGIVHESKAHEFILMSKTKMLKAGYLHINRAGNGFVDVIGEEDIFVAQSDLNGAINGDFVEIEVNRGISSEGLSGHVIRILKRDFKYVVGEIVLVNKKIAFKPDDTKLDVVIKLDKSSTKQCVEGHKVYVEIIKELGHKTFLGKVIRIIGHKNDPGVDIISIALKHGIMIDFSKEVEKELKDIPSEVNASELKNRTDLTNEMIFTIDGDDTKDIDDAISIKYENGNYILGVHIADVSNYVKIGSALYDAAYARGTSSYLADTVIPMIPHQLSNGICSLNPEVIRLTISCVMTINHKGKVIDYDIFPSYIKSAKQMTYKCVNKILDENIVPAGYENFVDTLKLMNELAKILRKEKIDRGYIDFGIDEAKVVQDESGKAIDIVRRVQGTGEKLIEDFMIAANETVATHISNMDLPFIYRVHDIPNSDKIEDFINLVHQLGYTLNTNLNKMTPLTMQHILGELHDKKEFPILSSMLLRSMKKAVYSPNNIGHFGLASQNYTHFTSPIRRFPDLTVHRLLRTYLFENRIDMETINFNSKYLVDVAFNSSEREVDAIEAEREVLAMKMAEYMSDKIGYEYQGIISGVQPFGIFVQLDNLVEGLVHISTLNGYFEYVPELLALIRQDKEKKYQIGDIINVRVISANKDIGVIDFEIIDGDDASGNKE